MKKLGVFFVFLLVGILLITFVNSLDCREADNNGYNNRAYYCDRNVNCASGCTLHEAGRCESGPRNFQCNSANGVLWQYSGNRCKRSFVCSDSGYTGAYQCSGNIKQAQYRTYSCGSSYNSCPSTDNWISVEVCTYGCTAGSCNTCAPSLTAANYSGQCGSGFSDGCSNSIAVSCAINSHCNVSVGKGICLPNKIINQPYFSSLVRPDLDLSSSNVGDTVLLRFPGESLENTTINYGMSIYNSSAIWWNPFTWFSKNWDNSQKITGTAYEPYTLTQYELHRFNASIAGTNQWNMSNNLTVLPANSTSNYLPTVVINSPLNDSKVQSGNLVWFNQSSFDEDDLLNVTWDFGDGNITSCPNYSIGLDSTKCNVGHIYSNKGVYFAKLTVKEMTRAQSSSQMLVVYVFSSGINVIPVISNPQFGISYGRFIDFNASGSYVANCSSSIIGGNFVVGNLNCTYVHAPNKIAGSNLNGYNLTYTWNMDGSIVSGNWSNYDSVVVFKYYFLNSGSHLSKLNLTYSSL